MKWSRYIHFVPSGNETILYNTLNSSIVVLENRIVNQITTGDLHLCPDDVISGLTNRRFIVHDEKDEHGEFVDAMQNGWTTDDTMRVVLLGTTDCNFACPYCYENGIDRNLYLNENTSTALVHYLRRVLTSTSSNIKQVYVTLYGGEPTLNWEPLINCTSRIMSLCSEFGIAFASSIVTNGYLLTKTRLLDLQRCNCLSAQITLDGPAHVHDTRRKLRSGKGSFDTIIENINTAISDELLPRIRIRINCDKQNIRYIEELLLFLKGKFPTEKIEISLGIVTETVEQTEAMAHHMHSSVFSLTELPDVLCRNLELVRSCGFEVSFTYACDGFCISKTRHSIVVAPDGSVYKCLSMVGRKDLQVGNLFSCGETEFPSYFCPELYDICGNENCEFLPICHGGCRFEAVVRNGTISVPYCKKRVYQEVNDHLLKAYANNQ